MSDLHRFTDLKTAPNWTGRKTTKFPMGTAARSGDTLDRQADFCQL